MQSLFGVKTYTFLVTALITLAGGLSHTVQAHAIVFVHIGDSLPSYLPIAVAQARLHNECDIHLIMNKSAHQLVQEQNILGDCKIVYCEDLSMTKEHLCFKQKCIKQG